MLDHSPDQGTFPPHFHTSEPGFETLRSMEQLKSLCQTLGTEVLRLRAEGLQVYEKSDGSKVTNADLYASQQLELILPQIRPGIVLSEENIKTLTIPPINPGQEWWLVDPIDGTSSFVNNYSGFAICTALIRDNQPVMGVIAVPAENALYYAAEGLGAYKVNLTTGEEIALNASTTWSQPFRLGVSYRIAADTQQAIDSFLQKNGIPATAQEPVSAALKYCQVAEGILDMAGSWTPLNIWDIAAADILIREAGGILINFETRQPFEYDPTATRADMPLAFSRTLLNDSNQVLLD